MKKIEESIIRDVFYFPKESNLKQQEGDLCFYYTYLNLCTLQNTLQEIPIFIGDMMDELKEREIDDRSEIITEYIDLNDEDLKFLEAEIENNPNFDNNATDDDDESWIDFFLNENGEELAIARLMNLEVAHFQSLKELTPSDLYFVVLENGPIAIPTTSAIEIPSDRTSLSALSEEIIELKNNGARRVVFNVGDCRITSEGHYCLVIGCQIAPKAIVYFIDPNYPNAILSMPFDVFKDFISINEYVKAPVNQLKPDLIIHTINHDRKLGLFSSSQSENKENNRDDPVAQNPLEHS